MTTTDTPNTSDRFLTAIQLLTQSKSILLTTHERTDADDLGTILAIKIALDKLGKTTKLIVKGGVPSTLQFLPGVSEVEDLTKAQGAFDLVVVSGCSTIDRTGLQGMRVDTIPILNLDHHPDNTNFGSVNLVIPEASAVAEITYELLKTWGMVIDLPIAQCLLAGIIADTGSFIHSNTTEKTLHIAGQLFEKGARPGYITKFTYGSKSPDSLKAWARALENTRVDYQKQMAFSMITKKDLADLGNPLLSTFDGIVETINKIPEAKFAMFLKQDGPVVKGSLRSDPHKLGGGVNVGELAKKYGGGGHKYAAGFSVKGTLIHAPEGGWKILPAN